MRSGRVENPRKIKENGWEKDRYSTYTTVGTVRAATLLRSLVDLDMLND